MRKMRIAMSSPSLTPALRRKWIARGSEPPGLRAGFQTDFARAPGSRKSGRFERAGRRPPRRQNFNEIPPETEVAINIPELPFGLETCPVQRVAAPTDGIFSGRRLTKEVREDIQHTFN
jgi:hypothetical protein